MARRIPIFALAVLAFVGARMPVAAADPVEDRKAVLNDFDQIAARYQARVLVKVVPRDTKIGKLTNIVLVAAQLIDPKTGRPGEYVSLTDYKWTKDEEFLLCFRVAAPVRFALFNLVRGADDKLSPQLELPCDDFPDSAKPIPPGGFYKDEDIKLKIQYTGEEIVRFAFTESSNPHLKDENRIGVYSANMKRVVTEVYESGSKYEGWNAVPAPRTRSLKFEDVAMVAGGKSTSGILEISLKKK